MPCLPNRATAWGTTITLQEEQSWGNLATPGSQNALGIDFIGETFRNTVARHEDISVGSRGMSTLIDGSHDPRGEITGELQPGGAWPILLKHAMGGSVVTSGSGPFSHVLTVGDVLPEGLTVEKRFLFRNAEKRWLRYYGSRVDQFHIRAGREGIVTARASLLSREEYVADADMNVSPEFTDTKPFNSLHGALTLTAGATTSLVAAVTSVELLLDNNINDGERTIEDGVKRAGLPWGRRAVTGVLTAFFTDDNWSFYADYLANSTLGLEFTLSSEGLSWVFSVPALKLTGVPTPQRAGRGPLNLDLPFTAILDQASAEMSVTVYNDDPQLSTIA